MTFSDPKVQAHYDSAVTVECDCPAEERPVRALIDAYYRFEFDHGEDSSQVKELTVAVLSQELRPALRSWYQRMRPKIHGHAIIVRDGLGQMAGESFV
jgi:hypothetical protein